MKTPSDLCEPRAGCHQRAHQGVRVRGRPRRVAAGRRAARVPARRRASPTPTDASIGSTTTSTGVYPTRVERPRGQTHRLIPPAPRSNRAAGFASARRQVQPDLELQSE